jgi:hypothetical protein
MDKVAGLDVKTLEVDKRQAFDRALWIVFQFDVDACELALDVPDIRANVEQLGIGYQELEEGLVGSKVNLLDEPLRGSELSKLLTDDNLRLEHADYLAIAIWDIFGLDKKTVHLGFRNPSITFRIRDLAENLWILDKKITQIAPQITRMYPDITIREIRDFFRKWDVKATKADIENKFLGVVLEKDEEDEDSDRFVVEYDGYKSDNFVIRRIPRSYKLDNFSNIWKKGEFATEQMSIAVDPFSRLGRDILCALALRGKGMISRKEGGISTLGQEIIDELPPAAIIKG